MTKSIVTINGKINSSNLTCIISWRNGEFIMDEPVIIGGNDSGPDPYSTLLSSLAGCTLVTLKLYAIRKKWSLKSISIILKLDISQNSEVVIDREIHLSNDVLEEQRKKLLMIASKCPISKVLEKSSKINTKIV